MGSEQLKTVPEEGAASHKYSQQQVSPNMSQRFTVKNKVIVNQQEERKKARSNHSDTGAPF